MVAGALVVTCCDDEEDDQPCSKPDASVKSFECSTLHADTVSWLLSQLMLVPDNAPHADCSCATFLQYFESHVMTRQHTRRCMLHIVQLSRCVALSLVSACKCHVLFCST